MGLVWVWVAGMGSEVRAVELAVGPNGTYPTVEDALAEAAPGDEIVVEAGRFDVNVAVVEAPGVIIRGAGSDPATGTVFGGGSGGSLWWISGGEVAVRDLAIDGSGTRRGVEITDEATVELDGVRIFDGFGDGGPGSARGIHRR